MGRARGGRARGHGGASGGGPGRDQRRRVQPVLVGRADRRCGPADRADAHVAGPARHRSLLPDHGPRRDCVQHVRGAARHPTRRRWHLARAHSLSAERPTRSARADRGVRRGDGLRDRAPHRPRHRDPTQHVHVPTGRQPHTRQSRLCDVAREPGRGRRRASAARHPDRQRGRHTPGRHRPRPRAAGDRRRVRGDKRHCNCGRSHGRVHPRTGGHLDRHHQRSRRPARLVPRRPREPTLRNAGAVRRSVRRVCRERSGRQDRRDGVAQPDLPRRRARQQPRGRPVRGAGDHIRAPRRPGRAESCSCRG